MESVRMVAFMSLMSCQASQKEMAEHGVGGVCGGDEGALLAGKVPGGAVALPGAGAVLRLNARADGLRVGCDAPEDVGLAHLQLLGRGHFKGAEVEQQVGFCGCAAERKKSE